MLTYFGYNVQSKEGMKNLLHASFLSLDSTHVDRRLNGVANRPVFFLTTFQDGAGVSVNGFFLLEKQNTAMLKAAIRAVDEHMYTTYGLHFQPLVVYTDDDAAGVLTVCGLCSAYRYTFHLSGLFMCCINMMILAILVTTLE